MDQALAGRIVEFGKPFLDAGFPLVGAAAICGNAIAESNCKPINPSSDGSDGALQWREAERVHRLSNMKVWCASNVLDWRTLPAQAKYTIYELSKDFALLSAQLKTGGRTIDNLTANFEKFFERPESLSDLDRRISYAKEAQAVLTPFAATPATLENPIGYTIYPQTHAPTPQLIPAAPQEVPAMNPVLAQILVQVASAFAEAIIGAIVKQVQTAPVPISSTPPPAPAPFDPNVIANLVQTVVAQELAKLSPPNPGAK